MSLVKFDDSCFVSLFGLYKSVLLLLEHALEELDQFEERLGSCVHKSALSLFNDFANIVDGLERVGHEGNNGGAH